MKMAIARAVVVKIGCIGVDSMNDAGVGGFESEKCRFMKRIQTSLLIAHSYQTTLSQHFL